jgi:hypothetical protein
MLVLHVTPTPVAFVDIGKGHRNPRTFVLACRCSDGATRWWMPRAVAPGMDPGAPVKVQGFGADGAPVSVYATTDGYGNVSAWLD